jgi:uncharacterized delta-60 repeat protein
VVGAGRPGGVNARNDFAIARFNADGTFDSTFGTGGKAYVDFFGSHDVANAVLIQPDGLILAIGHATTVIGKNDFAVARLTAAGVLDPTFDADGRVTVNVAGDVDLAFTGALQADGAIVIAGEVAAKTATRAIRASCVSSRTALMLFSGDGGVQIAYASITMGQTTSHQADGKIVLVGPGAGPKHARLHDRALEQGRTRATPSARRVWSRLDSARCGTSQRCDRFGQLDRRRGRGLIDDRERLDSMLAQRQPFDSSFAAAAARRRLLRRSDGARAPPAVRRQDHAAGAARNGTTTGVGLARIVP